MTLEGLKQGGNNRLILATILGILIGMYIYDLFLAPEINTKIEYVEVRTTDTVYTVIKDTVRIKDIEYVYERDTIIENYQPKIRGFRESFNTLYGNIHFTGEVLGELRFATVMTDLKLPVITNTIDKTKTITNTVMTKGFYAGASINSVMQPSVTAAYQDKDYIFDYAFTPSIQLHAIGVKKRIF